MLYCVDGIRDYEKIVEELSYEDLDGEEWLVKRTKYEFFIFYKGKPEKSPPFFEIRPRINEMITVTNTSIFLVPTENFETFCNIRDIIKNKKTVDVFIKFKELMKDYRFVHNKTLMDSEKRDK